MARNWSTTTKHVFKRVFTQQTIFLLLGSYKTNIEAKIGNYTFVLLISVRNVIVYGESVYFRN